MRELPKVFGITLPTWALTLLWAGFLALPVFSHFQSTDQGITSLLTMGAVLTSLTLGTAVTVFWIWELQDRKATR